MLTRTRNGKERHTASYRDATGHVRSAGTFATKQEAPEAIRRQEVDTVTGTRPGTSGFPYTPSRAVIF
jgi:hypothetical protein